jgi:enoyl-CoA hydratase
MPEVGIGFFPDVGATYALPRLPGATGTWLAVTGDRIKAADCVALGLATHYVPTTRHAELALALAGPEPVEAVLARFASDAGPPPVAEQRALIDRCFAPGSVPEIIAGLTAAAAGGNTTAARHLATLATKSPTSMAIAARQMQLGRNLSFYEAMALEFRIVSRVMMGHDFYEGVRAVIIDKDNAARWQPSSIEEVTPAMIDAYVAPLGANELRV